MQLYIPVISKVLTSAQVNAIESLIDKYDGVTTGILTEASKSGDVKRGTDIVRDYLVPIGNDFDKTIDSYQQELQKRSEDYCDSLASDIEFETVYSGMERDASEEGAAHAELDSIEAAVENEKAEEKLAT